MDFAGWSREEPARAYNLRHPADLQELWSLYGGARKELFADVLSQADRAGATSALVEYRYIDLDYRSEYSHFYSTTYRRYPSVTHRIHFFSKLLDDAATDASHPTRLDDYGYLGYTVVRPVDASPVGRTMIQPPDELAAHVSCLAQDVVNVFGSELTVRGAPFMAQDSQLGVCVHVTAWVCAYYHHLRFGSPRLLPADIAGYTPMEHGRLVPSSAVTVTQLVQMLERAGIPPVTYNFEHFDRPGEAIKISCRYLDSGIPVIVAGGGHTFVLVGYRWVREASSRRVQFIRHDDQTGPYESVDRMTYDRYHPWEYLIAPLPAKVYMSGERAEALGRATLQEALAEAPGSECEELVDRLANGECGFRTSVQLSNEFKNAMSGRTPEVAASYQWLQLPRWVWVVELVDVELWRTNQPSVLGEAIVDATGHAEDGRTLAWRVPGLIGWRVPDLGGAKATTLPLLPPQASVVPTDTSILDV